MTARLEALDQVHAACWQQLCHAAEDPGHGWRRLALATVSAPGDGGDADLPGLPDVRTVVLREVDPARRLLVMYTDARSPKVAQLRAQPRASLMAWCPALGWQLRMRARLAVDTGGLAVSTRWASLKLRPAAQDYLSPLPPGTPLNVKAPSAPGVARTHAAIASAIEPGPLAPNPAQVPPDRTTRGHFAVMFATIDLLDWLELDVQGHRRAGFNAQGDGHWRVP